MSIDEKRAVASRLIGGVTKTIELVAVPVAVGAIFYAAMVIIG